MREAPSPRGVDVLRFAVKLLDGLGARWWLDYGALLGAVWKGGMLPWDRDVDLGVLVEHHEAVILAEREVMAAGLEFKVFPLTGRRFGGGGRVQLLPREAGQIPVELVFWVRDARGRLYRREYLECDRGKGREFDEALLFPLRTLAFEGVQVQVPARARTLCEHRYGLEWREPDGWAA